ncbi:hypothetical protein FCIRC_6907 [Fusarium circinatum]|uniref:Uncharacterized protein n=1 Tax=Fusarium circinatum TaxID=48490 RepID=A0A8H5WV83_FUSCI|nr:hypothetical protein FCIRC_6907 [Fusarium circinatum]
MRPLPQPPWMRRYRRIVPSIIASIRDHPEAVAPTLESIPQIDESLMATEPFSPFSSLIRDMQETEFKSWGFVIFRSVYTEESQAQWESYIDFFKATVEDKLKYMELWTLLEPHLEWTIMEDRETFDNASKEQVRDRFSQWVSERSIERDGAGAEDPLAMYLPRYRYCVYVDQKCLDTVDEYAAWVDAGAEGHKRAVVCAMLDVKCEPGGQGRDGFPSIEGCTKEYTGWIYTGVQGIPTLYDSLFHQALKEQDAPRPPGVMLGSHSMPIN